MSAATILVGIVLFGLTIYYIDLNDTIASARRMGLPLPIILLASAAHLGLGDDFSRGGVPTTDQPVSGTASGRRDRRIDIACRDHASIITGRVGYGLRVADHLRGPYALAHGTRRQAST